MSFFLSIMFGVLGMRFGKLGAASKVESGPPPEPGNAPTMQFNDAANSQLLATLEDF